MSGLVAWKKTEPYFFLILVIYDTDKMPCALKDVEALHLFRKRPQGLIFCDTEAACELKEAKSSPRQWRQKTVPCSDQELSQWSESEPCLPVIIHHCNGEADLVHVLWRDIKDDGLIINGIQCVLLCGCFPLFQSPSLAHQRHFDIRIWVTVSSCIRTQSYSNV